VLTESALGLVLAATVSVFETSFPFVLALDESSFASDLGASALGASGFAAPESLPADSVDFVFWGSLEEASFELPESFELSLAFVACRGLRSRLGLLSDWVLPSG
jgi:hypothetical protein